MMKKLLALAVCAAMILSLCAVAQADMLADIQAKGKIVVGASVGFPPYGSTTPPRRPARRSCRALT